jgi:surface antigen
MEVPIPLMTQHAAPCRALRSLRGPLAVLALVAGLLLPSVPAHAYTDDYPWRYDTTRANDSFGFVKRQCTSYVAWRLYKAGHRISNRGTSGGRSYSWGNGSNWDSTASLLRKTITRTPRVGAVAQWNAYESSRYYSGGAVGTFKAGAYGHVAWVVAVYSDHSVLVRQYNMTGNRSYSQMRVTAPRYLYV